MPFNRITSEEVYATLLADISSGRFKFGQALITKDLSGNLGASRFQVIGALSTLQSQGFVTIVPQVGCQIVRPSPAAIGDFFRMVGCLEGILAQFAAERRPDAELCRLDEITRQLEALADDPRAPANSYHVVGEKFRNLIHRWSSSPELVSEQRIILARFAFYLSQLEYLPAMDQQAFKHYNRVVAAIRGRRGHAARRATESFFEHYSSAVLRNMELL